MSIIATRSRTSRGTRPSRAKAGLCFVAATTLLSGCSGGSATAPGDVVTVTTTPTVTAGTAARTMAAAPTTGSSSTVTSDVLGRKFDLGTIVRVQNEGGVPVLIFDRWTARGVADSTIAARGVPLHVHTGAPYQNLNTSITYRIPVARGAVFTYRHCVAVDKPPVQRPSTLDEFTHLRDPETVVLLSLDPQGRAVVAENDPAC
jgi:hypothetical protein